MSDGREDPLRRLPGDVLHRPGPDRGLRPLRQRRRADRALRPADRAHPHPRRRRARWCPSRRRATGTARSPARRTRFVTGIGAGTTYPDYKPAPFIVSREVEGADVVTVVTEAIFSYCGVKVKIDTDRHLGAGAADGARRAARRSATSPPREYGSQMLSLGGVAHLTGGSKAEGRATCAALLGALQPRAGGARHRRRRRASPCRPGRPPVVDGVRRAADAGRLRLGDDRHVRRRSGAGWSTRWWWSTTTSPASSPSTRRARCSAGRRPASASRATARRRGATSASPSRALGWGGTRLTDPAGDPRAVRREEGRAARADAC